MRKALVALVCLGLFTFGRAGEETAGAEGIQGAMQDPSVSVRLQSGAQTPRGDFNGDASLDCADADMLVAEIIAGTNNLLFDMDANGFVNYEDFTAPVVGWLAVAGMQNTGVPYPLADMNLDGVVDALDFLVWNSNQFTSIAAWCSGDVSADGVVDGQDFILWNGVKFTGAGKPAAETPGVQLSGTPGDGVPDIYYYVTAVAAPNGQTKAAGTLSLDTDGADWVALLVASPDLTANCVLCNGNMLGGNTFTTGWINGSTQWIRTNPLTGAGPIGTFDVAQLAGLGAGDFPKLFDSGQASVMLAKDNGDVIYTQVTFVGGTPDVEVTPLSIDFGNVAVGAQAGQELVIRNVGTDELILSGWSNNNPRFSNNLTVPVFLSPLDSVVVTQTFSPISVGQQDGLFNIASNDPDESTVQVSLTGFGILPSVVNADAGGDKSVCRGDSVQIGGSPTATGNGPFSYAWSPASGLSDATAANPKASPATTTMYYVTVTGLNGVTDIDSAMVTVHVPPSVNTGGTQYLVVGESGVVLGGSPTASGNGPFTYSWTPAAALDDPTLANPTASPTASTLYTVEVTDVNGCKKTGQTFVAAYTLIGLNDVQQSTGVDELMRFPDATTGDGQLVGSLGDNFIETEALASFNRYLDKPGLDQMAVVPIQPFYAVDEDRLLSIDPFTGNGTVIGNIGFSDVDGIDFNPINGQLYGVTYGSNKILHIDTQTGVGTEVAGDVIVGRRLNDMAFRPTGELFIITDSTPPRIYEIDLTTGAKINKWILVGASSMEGLLWHPRPGGQTLWSTADRNGGKDLVTITLGPPGSETGTVTFVNPSGFGDLEALALLPADIARVLLSRRQPTDTNPLPTPQRTALHQNVPNPFNPVTRIQFDLTHPGHVLLEIYDAQGRRVQTLVNGSLGTGSHSVTWRGASEVGQQLGSGMYFYRLRTNDYEESRRMVLLK